MSNNSKKGIKDIKNSRNQKYNKNIKNEPPNVGIAYDIIRSNRSTMSIKIEKDGHIVVRVPFFIPEGMIKEFVNSKEKWIRKHLNEINERKEQNQESDEIEKLSMEDIKRLAKESLKVIPERVRYYAPLIGVSYGRITIRNQKSRWGSCSAKGNLNFNCLLMLTPPEVIDSVVVHELCHRKEMNHSKRFYQEIYKVFPEYDKWNGWLKEHGNAIMMRMLG